MKKLLLSTLMLSVCVFTLEAATKLAATPSLENLEHYTDGGGYPVTNVTDGNYTTKFWSNSNQAPGQAILLTLGEASQIGNITLYFAAGDRPAAADIQVSATNNGDWETVASFTESDIQTSGSDNIYTCDAAGREAKYVRLYLTGSANSWLQVYEFEVYQAVQNQTAAPVFDPASKAFAVGEEGKVTITSDDAGAVIYYTTDGTEPSTNSDNMQNGGFITISTESWAAKATTIKAVAKADGKELSSVVSETYTVEYPYCQPVYTATSNVGSISTLKVTGGEEEATYSYPNNHANRQAAIVDDFFTAVAGTELTLNMRTKEASWGSVRIYADLNGNNVFDSDENIVRVGDYNAASGTNEKEVTDQKFTIPQSTPAGKYLMRVFIVPQGNQAQWESTDACGTYSEGGYYDFAFNVIDGSANTQTPVFTPVSGTSFDLDAPAEITLTSEDGAVIYYTTNGDNPQAGTGASIQNGCSITLDTSDWGSTITVKAVAQVEGKEPSSVSSAVYTVNSPYCQPTVPTNGGGDSYVGQIATLTTIDAETDANWTNPATDKLNGHVGVIDNAFTAMAGQSVTLNITSKNTTWGAIRVYADLNGDYAFDSDENIVRVGSTSTGNDALPVSQQFTIDPSTPAGKYLMRVFYVARSSDGDVEFNITDPCGTYAQGGYYDFAFNVIEAEPVVPTEDKEVTANEEETGDAAYVNVTVKAGADAQMPVWTVGENAVSAQSLDIEIAADATTPEIALSGSGTITAGTISVNRAVKAGEWAFMSLPFAIDIANVTVGGDAAVIDGNIRFLVYDGAKRASNSVEQFSGTGWVAKESGTIDANTGFAVAVNENNGDEQTVTFTAANFTMDASDKEIALSKYPAEVNDGMDADWNFKGNPMLQKATKGTGYSLYLYNPGDDTYDEYAGMESAIFAPFAAWFVQSTGLTDGIITFSHDGTSVAADSEASKDGLFAVSINGGEDEARITVAGGTSQSYVINEDAMYFAPNSRKVSQLYLIDGDGARIASSVVPEPYSEIRLAYDAVTAGEQTLTVTSLIPGTAVTLVDNETGKAMQMGEGSEYTFTSAAGLDSDRFVLKTAKVDLSGIETAGAEASGISAVAADGTITVYGAEAGSVISVYTVNGAMVSSTVAADEETVLPVSVNGVLLVKAGEEVIKVVK